MTKSKMVEQFIRDSMEMYSIGYSEFFSEYSIEEDELLELPIAIGDSLNMELVEKAAIVLGTSPEALIQLDGEEIRKWYKKYFFFEHRTAFELAYADTYLSDNVKAMRLMNVLFDTTFSQKQVLRFDYENVRSRLVKLLKEIDGIVPGTFHENAKITNLKIDTKNFCHYPKVNEMIESYLSMYERVKDLFFEAINRDLVRDEIQEYNFIVSVLGISDMVCATRGYLFYDMLLKYRDIYRQEGYSEFSDYITLNRNKSFKPWRCAEFVENEKLVQKYTAIMPEAKGMMREFAQKTSKFECEFIWSDAHPVCLPPDEETELDNFLKSIGEPSVPIEEREPEHTTVYVKKNADELNGNEKYSEILKRLSGTAKEGGITLPADKKTLRFNMERMKSRIGVVGGSYHV